MNYNLRGKCKELSEEFVASKEKGKARLVRGFYYCPFWGKQQHWWAEVLDETNNMWYIVDVTKDQFPSKGIGEYEEFDGIVECEQCGKEMKEEDAKFYGNYVFCSGECIARCVGL